MAGKPTIHCLENGNKDKSFNKTDSVWVVVYLVSPDSQYLRSLFRMVNGPQNWGLQGYTTGNQRFVKIQNH